MEAGRKSVEGRGKTVDDAILDALTKLGASRESVDLEVISEGSRGVWGIGAEDARVRAVLKTSRPTTGKPPRVAVAEREPEREIEPAPKAPPLPELPEGATEAEIGRHVVANLLQKMGFQAEVVIAGTIEPSEPGGEPAVVLDVRGDDLGLLIGRRGETLRDLQFITRLIVSRKVGHWPNLIVDVEQYRTHREQVLQQLARRMADKVRLTRQPVPLEPMPPNERRIIHLTLRDDPYVTTHSIGEGEARKVVISPKRETAS